MTAISPTAATPPPAPPRTQDGQVPDLPTTEPTPPGPTTGSGTDRGGINGLRLRITGWMEEKFGRAAMPIAAVAGGAVGGTIGMLTLGPVGAAVGGAGGAFMGALLFMAG